MPRTARKPAAPAAKATGHKKPRPSKAVKVDGTVDATVRPRKRRGETVAKPAPKAAGLSPIYAAAIRGDVEALAELRTMTPADRAAICPPGLTGLCRKRFINEALTGTEQRAEAKGRRIASEAAIAKAAAAKKSTPSTDTEENDMPATTTRKPRTRKPAADAGPADLTAKLNDAITPKGKKPARKAPAATTDGFSAAAVAKDAGIDARKFRGFLRSKNINRQFANKAAAAKAVKAFKASLNS